MGPTLLNDERWWSIVDVSLGRFVLPEQLLSLQDLAELLKVPEATIYGWNHRGLGPTPLHVGRHVRYRPSDVDAWLDAKAVHARMALDGGTGT